MKTFRQHIPAFVEMGDERPPLQEWETESELLALKPLKIAAEEPGFSHFALEDRTVLSIYQNSLRWWVEGFVSSREGLSFPEWDGGKYKVRLNGEIVIIPGSQVGSSCGDRVWLKDGTQLEMIRQ